MAFSTLIMHNLVSPVLFAQAVIPIIYSSYYRWILEMNTCNAFVIRPHQVKVHLIRMVCKLWWQDTSCGVYLIVQHELTIEFSPAKIYCSRWSGSSVVAPNTLCCSESSNQLVICPMCSMLHFNTWNSGPKLHICAVIKLECALIKSKLGSHCVKNLS